MTASATQQKPASTASGLTTEELTELVCTHALEKKASGLLVLDVSGVVAYTDRFIICSGGTDRQTKAIADSIQVGLKQDARIVASHVEGMGDAQWVLLDYLDVVVHIFTPELRELYQLERLWSDVPVTEIA